jgi:hypothetical protein
MLDISKLLSFVRDSVDSPKSTVQDVAPKVEEETKTPPIDQKDLQSIPIDREVFQFSFDGRGQELINYVNGILDNVDLHKETVPRSGDVYIEGNAKFRGSDVLVASAVNEGIPSNDIHYIIYKRSSKESKDFRHDKMMKLLAGEKVIASDEDMSYFEENLPEDKVNNLRSIPNKDSLGILDKYIVSLSPFVENNEESIFQCTNCGEIIEQKVEKCGCGCEELEQLYPVKELRGEMDPEFKNEMVNTWFDFCEYYNLNPKAAPGNYSPAVQNSIKQKWIKYSGSNISFEKVMQWAKKVEPESMDYPWEPLEGEDTGEGWEPMENESVEEDKKKPSAKLRHRGDVVFPADSSKVTDDKDHFPINSLAQARNALARAGQYSSSPKWYKGSLSALKTKVHNAVKRKYPSIEVSEAYDATNPGSTGNDTRTIVAKGIKDQQDAQNIARSKRGKVVSDEDNPKEFMVVVGESKINEERENFSSNVQVNATFAWGEEEENWEEFDLLTRKVNCTYSIDVGYSSWGINDINLFFEKPISLSYNTPSGEQTIEISADELNEAISWVAGGFYGPDAIDLHIGEGGAVSDLVVEVVYINKG